ncbi:hypothetical protein D9M71_189790 [compost metagenome]
MADDRLGVGGEGVLPLLGVLGILPASALRGNVIGGNFLEGLGLGGGGLLTDAQALPFGISGGHWIDTGTQQLALVDGGHASCFQAHIREAPQSHLPPLAVELET